MSDFLVARDDRCPIAVADEGGDQEPCDHETTGWGWYDGGEHEPMLYQACYSHETDGAAGIAEALAERDRLRRCMTLIHKAIFEDAHISHDHLMLAVATILKEVGEDQ